MFWNTIPCSVANYSQQIIPKLSFFRLLQFVDVTLKSKFKIGRCSKKYEFIFDPSLIFSGNTYAYALLPLCLGFDVLNLFSSIKTVSSWFPIGGVSTLSDMMMTCFESSALAPRSATATFLAMEKSLGWKTCNKQGNFCLFSSMKVLPLRSYF